MSRFLASYLSRIDSAYRDRSYLVGQKARLLAAISALVMTYVVVNIAKNAWISAPEMLARDVANVVLGVCAYLCFRGVMKGRLEAAGNRLALAMVIVVHGGLALAPFVITVGYPLSTAFQVFGFDLVFLLFAVLFASRRVATAVFAIVAAGHVGIYFFILKPAHLSPLELHAARTLLREGLIAMGLLFCVAITMIQMIETAHHRSEESLNRSQLANKHLEKLEHEARSLSERRREFMEIQREFVSMVSHEFRTPLTTIQGSQFLLERLLTESGILTGDLAEKATRWLSLQDSGIKTLNKLVDQVLTLNRIDHMTSEASLESLAPAGVLAETVANFNDSMAMSRVVLSNELPEGYRASIDAVLVKAAAENLISNGLKYSGLEKPVRVRLYAETDGWVIDVADEGHGIPLEDQPNIFHPFFRAGNVGTIPGTGLGLSIAQRAASFHGGRVEFTSTLNVGTTFKLRFPSAARTPADPAIGWMPMI